MANFSRLRAPGFWVVGSVVLPEEFEDFDDARPAIINARDGSTHAPTVQVELGGQGLRVSGPSRFDGITIAVLAASGTFTVANTSDLIVANGGDLIVQAGGDLDIGTGVGLANLTVKSGSLATIASGGSMDVRGATINYDGSAATYNAGSLLTANADAIWNVGGIVTFTATSGVTCNGATTLGSSTNLQLSPARSFEVHSTEAVPLTWGTPGPPAADPDVWLIESVINAPAPMIRTRAANAAGRRHVIILRDLPPGGTLAEVVITTRGYAGSAGFTLPTYRIVRWRGANAVINVSALVTDVHAADASDWTTDVLETTITPAVAHTIETTHTYALLVNHVYQGAGAGMDIFDCKATGTYDELRQQ
jgi:hypothetical protein